MKSKSLLVVATHPVQYMAPWFKYLAAKTEFDLTVWYAILPDENLQGVGFGRPFAWDTELLDGYRWEALHNHAAKPSLDTFFGTRLKHIDTKLRSLSPSIVLVTGWHQFSLVQVAIACKRAGIRCFIRGESNHLKSRPAYKRILHRMFLRLFDSYLYIGEANRQFYLESGVKTGQTFFTPYFVDNEWFKNCIDSTGETRQNWRLKFGIGLEEFVVLFAGKLQQKKNVSELIQAMNLMRSGCSNTCLVIAGEGELREELQQLARKLGVKTVFAGFVNQSGMAEVYTSVDCLVLPSDHDETWGLVVNEAMNFSIPAVVSDRVGCGPDLIRQGITGYCYRFGHPEQLADILGTLSENPAERVLTGERAFQHIQQYSIEAAAQGLLNAAANAVR